MNKCVSIRNFNPCVDNNNSLFDINNGSCCCVGIKPYCRNQCVCYNSCCCCPCPPIIPTGPMPPMPPMPPIPPGPMGSIGQFEAPREVLTNNDPYIFNTVNIQGNAIAHVDGTSDIILAPNTLYEFAWETSSTIQVIDFFTSGAVLLLNGVEVPGSRNTVNGPGTMNIIAMANGMFMTGNAQGILTLNFLTDFLGGALTDSTLTLREILP